MAANGWILTAVKPLSVCSRICPSIGTSRDTQTYGGLAATRLARSPRTRCNEDPQPHQLTVPCRCENQLRPPKRSHRDGGSSFSPLLISHKVLRGPTTSYHRTAQHHH